MPRILSAIDIGSNTVHLLVAEVGNGGSLRRIENRSEWLSLGEDVARTGRIPDPKLAFLAELLRNYEVLAKQCRAVSTYVFATEAMRSAENGIEAIDLLHRDTGIRVNVIDASTEAAFSLAGVSLDYRCADEFLLLEVGGGSAQAAFCRDGELTRQWSIPIGTGRISGVANLGDPPTSGQISVAKKFIEERIADSRISDSCGRVVASGGIARGLIRALHPDGEKFVAREELDYLRWACQRLTHAQIGQRFGVKPKRAAAMLAGTLVFGALLEKFGAESMYVSEYGVREGAILLQAQVNGEAWLG